MQKANSILIICLLFLGCSPERQLARLLAKHPQLANVDTTYMYDTIIKPGSRLDTVFVGKKDTFYINKNRVKTQIIKEFDTLYISQTVLPDTLISENMIIEKIISGGKRRFFRHKWQLGFWLVLSVIIWQIVRKILAK